MLPRTEVSREAVAAFLYNAIYGQDAGEGWMPDEPAYDPTYRKVFLCFAQAVIKELQVSLEVSDTEVVQQAAKLVNEELAGFSWQSIAIDEKVVSLLEVAEPHIDAVRDFLINPDGYPEGEFLREVTEEQGAGAISSNHPIPSEEREHLTSLIQAIRENGESVLKIFLQGYQRHPISLTEEEYDHVDKSVQNMVARAMDAYCCLWPEKCN